VVTEDSPILPDDEYGLSKWLGEELARYHARRQDLATVALRLGMFVPETFERYGFRLLFGGVDDRDVAQAVLLALEHEPAAGFEAVNVMAEVPFQPADAVGLHADPAAVLERYGPGCITLFVDRGLELEELLWGRLIWPIDKAKGVLGYRPRHNFGEFLTALEAGDTGYYRSPISPGGASEVPLAVPAEDEPISAPMNRSLSAYGRTDPAPGRRPVADTGRDGVTPRPCASCTRGPLGAHPRVRSASGPYRIAHATPRWAPAVTTTTKKGSSAHPHAQYLGRSPPAEEGPNPTCSAGRIPVVYRAGGRDQGVSGLG